MKIKYRRAKRNYKKSFVKVFKIFWYSIHVPSSVKRTLQYNVATQVVRIKEQNVNIATIAKPSYIRVAYSGGTASTSLFVFLVD